MQFENMCFIAMLFSVFVSYTTVLTRMLKFWRWRRDLCQ